MESEPEDAGLSHTGPLSHGIHGSRKSVGRRWLTNPQCRSLRPQRVPVSSINDDNQSGDEESQQDTATPSNGSATIGTVSAILAASRRLERNPSGEPAAAAADSGGPDKENTAGRTRLAHPYDLLTPLPRRTGSQAPAGRTPRQPLSRIDTPYKTEAPQPTAASAVKRPFVVGEPPATEKRSLLQPASRSHSTLPAAEPPRPTPGLSRGLSEGRLLQSAGPRRVSMPVLSERPSGGTPPDQRAAALNHSGSAPAAGPAARLSPAGTPRPAPGQDAPCRPVPAQDAAGRQTQRHEAHGGVRGSAQTAVGSAQDRLDTGRATPYRSAAAAAQAGRTAASGSGEHCPNRPVADTGWAPGAPSRCAAVGGPGPHRRASQQEAPPGSLPQQPALRPTATGAGDTQRQPTPTSGQDSAPSLAASGRDGSRPVNLPTSAPDSSGQWRLGPPAVSAVLAASTAVLSTSSVHISAAVTSVSGSRVSVSSSSVPPRLPARSPPGQSRAARPQTDSATQTDGGVLADSGTQTDESAAAAAMPPPPTELQAGKRQLRTITVNQRDYSVLKQIGRGGSSKVYQVFDCDMRSLAIKQVFLENTDEATASGYKNEIALLRSLQHSDRVVRLMDFEHRADRQLLYIVMEKGDTDLTTLLRSYNRLNEVDANMCKFFWGEMLRCVDVIHRKNIVHSDLKPSNFLMVAGRLKLIDFGIASQIQSDCTSIIKDAQVGTFNYMSPEAIEAQQVTRNGASQTAIKISRRSDVWSLGCILYNFVYGITPFGHIKQVMGKLMAIVNQDHEIEFPAVSDCQLLAVLRGCLRRDPYRRPSIEQLLNDPYLTGRPCQCQK